MQTLYFKDVWQFKDLTETRMYGSYIMCNVEKMQIEVIRIHKTSCHIVTYKFNSTKHVQDYMLGLIGHCNKLEETTRLAYMTIRNQFHNQATYESATIKIQDS